MQESSAVDSLLNALMSIGRLMRQRYGGEALEPGTFWLLKSLGCVGAMRVTELAAQLQLDTSTVSRQVQQLEKAGFVERTTDPQDRRAQIVGLSAEGRGTLDAGLARRKADLVEHFETWDPNEVKALEHLLNKFVAGIDIHETSTPERPDPAEFNTEKFDSENPVRNTDSTQAKDTDRSVAELEYQ